MTPVTNKMKRTLKVPRGPPEWGEILYEPRWVYESKYRAYGIITLDFLRFLTGLIFFSILLVLDILRNDIGLSFFIFFSLVVFCIFGCAYQIIIMYIAMPYRIYQGGITKPFVPFSKGFHRQEVLIPFPNISSLEISKRGTIFIQYEMKNGKKGRLKIDDHNLENIDTIKKIMIKKCQSIDVIDRRS